MITMDVRHEVETIFSTSLDQSPRTAQRVASAWFQFSKFVPSFLEEMANLVDQPVIKKRIFEIIEEERGDGCEEANHSNLFRIAANKVGVKITNLQIDSIFELHTNTRSALLHCKDSEAFAVGIAYGLEFIAKENIVHLLRYTSKNNQDTSRLSKTSFFTIHFKNEIDHINKCEDNVRIVTRDSSRIEYFFKGFELSKNFWKKFWNEALS